MKRFIVALIVSAIVLFPTVAHADNTPILIGDSIGGGTRDMFLDVRPLWEVDAVPGRLVTTLPARVDNRLETGAPRRVIIELGTNTVAGWTKADYEAEVDKFPKSIQILMVTPYVRSNNLDPDLPRGSLADTRTYYYAKWMNEIANDSGHPNVCTVPWRATVINNPNLLNDDGVHPNWAGKQKFVSLLDTYIDHENCQGFRKYL